MITQDYLMRMLLAFFQGLVQARKRAVGEEDFAGAADMLENMVGEASGLDVETFLMLSPDSIATILRTTGVDVSVTEFMARSLMQASQYREKAGDLQISKLRREQASAIAKEYGHDLTIPMEQWLEEHDYSRRNRG